MNGLNSYKKQYLTKQIVLILILFASLFSGYAQNDTEGNSYLIMTGNSF